ncbi:hypothetical protein [Levilactobacillus brevis]|uniref:hypothetical protein n=1 Tax=Levilactobacillus brevis TaxID=1580 RepID=UPI00339D1C50
MDNDISSTLIANRSGISEDSVKRLIRNNMSFLEEFGRVDIEVERSGEIGGRPGFTYHFNIYQAWFIVSCLRNTGKTIQLKMDMAKQMIEETRNPSMG